MEYKKCDKCGGDCKPLKPRSSAFIPDTCVVCGSSYYECYECFLNLFEGDFCCKACGRNNKIDKILKNDN